MWDRAVPRFGCTVLHIAQDSVENSHGERDDGGCATGKHEAPGAGSIKAVQIRPGTHEDVERHERCCCEDRNKEGKVGEHGQEDGWQVKKGAKYDRVHHSVDKQRPDQNNYW